MPKARPAFLLSLAGLIGLTGCFELDDQLVAHADSGSDAGDAEAGAAPADDAGGALRSADADTEDADSPILDADIEHPDVDPVVVPEPCAADGACEPTAYCSAVSGQCEPRCDPEGACVVAEPQGLFQSLLGAGSTLYAVSTRTFDKLGNMRADQVLYAIEPNTAWRVVESGVCDRLIDVRDGVLTCVDTELGLLRVTTDGGTEPVILAAGSIDAAWATDQYLYWSGQTPPSYMLLRMPHAGGPAEQIAAAPDHWLTGNARYGVRVQDESVVLYGLEDASQTRSLDTPCHAFDRSLVALDEAAFYCSYPTEVAIQRVPLDGSRPQRLSAGSECPLGGRFLLAANQVFWHCYDDVAQSFQLKRNTIPAGDPELLVRMNAAETGGDPNVSSMAILDTALIYQNPAERRLFTRPL